VLGNRRFDQIATVDMVQHKAVAGEKFADQSGQFKIVFNKQNARGHGRDREQKVSKAASVAPLRAAEKAGACRKQARLPRLHISGSRIGRAIWLKSWAFTASTA
jgi:hypothetical protein